LRSNVVLLPALWFCRVVPAEAAEREQLIQLVSDAVTQNYSLIQSAEFTWRETLVSGEAAPEELVLRDRPEGGRLNMVNRPQSEWTLKVALHGDDLRMERSGAGNVEIILRRDGKWTQYVPSDSTAWIRTADGLPSIFPIDPRDTGSDDIRRPFLDIFRNDKIVSAELSRDESGSGIVTVVTQAADGNQATYEFASEVGFLPTKMQTRWADGSLLQHVVVTYRKVLDGCARFPERIVRRFYAQGATRSAGATGWRQQISRQLVGELVVNGTIADEQFVLDLPVATRVIDTTTDRVYKVSPEICAKPHHTWWYTAALTAILAGVVSVRRYRQRFQ
jgi:hypothetical protein